MHISRFKQHHYGLFFSTAVTQSLISTTVTHSQHIHSFFTDSNTEANMFSKAFVAAALLGAATAVPLGGLPALQKESSTSSGRQAESSPASSSFEQPAPQAAQPAGLPTSAPHGAPSAPPPWAQHGEDRKADVSIDLNMPIWQQERS